MSLPAILLLTLAFVFIVLIAWFIYSLVWGKPWSINLLYMRTFLRFALDGPELLTSLGILAASIPLPWIAVLIANDRPPLTGLSLARQVVEVLYAGYQSIEEGRKISLI